MGPLFPARSLVYLISIVNGGAVPAYNIVVTDDLNGAQAGQLAYVNGSGLMNGSAAGVSFAGSTINANYGSVYGALAPGAIVVLSFRVNLNPNAVPGTKVINTAIATWNKPIQTTTASVPLVVAKLPPAPGVLNGSVWYDANFDAAQDSRERALAGWTVELYSDNQLSQSVQTDDNGVYRIPGVVPNDPADTTDTAAVKYELRLRAPGAGPNTAMLGRAASPFTNGLQRISDIIVPAGANMQGLNLPIHPNGVIYNSLARTPVAGTTLTMLDARSTSPLPAACFDDAAQQGQITLADGYYRFDINFSDPACPSGGDYLIGVTVPTGTNYMPAIRPSFRQRPALRLRVPVPACPARAGDAIPGTAQFCEVQASEFSPAASVLPRSAGTAYRVRLLLDNSQIPGSSQIFNNHIPVDPLVPGLLTISKTTSVVNVSRGQLIPYTITANNHGSPC